LKQRLDEDSLKGDCTTFFQLAEGLSRLEAAKLFYQICGKNLNKFLLFFS